MLAEQVYTTSLLNPSCNDVEDFPVLRSCLFPFVCLCLVIVDCSVFAQQPSDFAHDVLPVLKKHCVPCHGGREAKGSFSMNHRELVVDSGHIVVGKPDESHLLNLILSSDRETQMPPSDRERLSDKEKDVKDGRAPVVLYDSQLKAPFLRSMSVKNSLKGPDQKSKKGEKA